MRITAKTVTGVEKMSEYIYDSIFAPTEAVKTVAEADGTPFYLYDEQGIRNSVCSIHEAFSQLNGHQNFFLIRENNNPGILSILEKAGTGVSACSHTELLMAKNCGFSGERLIYEPSRVDREAEVLAKQLDATWMINGKNLLPKELPNRIILRYHPSEERLTSVQFAKVGKSKNGFCRPQLFEVLSELHSAGVAQLGLALQVASYSIKPGFWEKKTEILLSLAETVKEKLGISLWCIHIGEGPGLPYQPRVTAPTVLDEAEKVCRLFRERAGDHAPTLYTGVVRQLMEHNGIMVAKILEQREIYNTYLILDAGIGHYLRPVLKQAYRHISILGKNRTENRRLYFLAGELPDEFDHPVLKGRMLPKVAPGDYCVFHDVGCGARSMAMLYGCKSIAAEYLYKENGEIIRIAPGRTEQEVLDFLTAL